jgi:hypothetical protein
MKNSYLVALVALSLMVLGCLEPIEQTSILAEVTFSPTPATYNSNQDITLNHPDSGTTIYYTTDGSNPEAGVSTEYTGPFTITGDNYVTIKAIAIKAGSLSSSISTGSYTIDTRPGQVEIYSGGWREPDWSTPGFSRRIAGYTSNPAFAPLRYWMYSVTGKNVDATMSLTATNGAGDFGIYIYESKTATKTYSQDLYLYNLILSDTDSHSSGGSTSLSIPLGEINFKPGYTYYFTNSATGGGYDLAYSWYVDLKP